MRFTLNSQTLKPRILNNNMTFSKERPKGRTLIVHIMGASRFLRFGDL